MMSISGVSSSILPIAQPQGVQTAQVNGKSDPDGDGDDGGRIHKSHGGGGHMRQALTQALQSLGLSMPQGAGGAGSPSQVPGAADGDADSGGSTSAANALKNDMRQFMHALFQAVKGSTSTDPSAAGSGSTDPKAGFAAGLSALISQASSGSAPADLQSAFSKLASDLQQANPAAVDATAVAGAAGATAQPTLQALLTNLQQDLGYGNSSTYAVGNSISTQV
jgi:hypothetical protein